MNRQVTLPAGQPASLTFQANWDIEDCGAEACDYAYVEVNDGTGFKPIAGNITKAAEGNGIDGTSTGWQPATFDLSAYAGKTIGLQFRYTTDPAAGGKGFFADEIAVTSGATAVVTSGAETSPDGWTLNGFSAVGASFTSLHDNYYMASHINYVDHDQYLQTGPYNFGWASTLPDKVEHFPYQDGLLIWYWDTSQEDNNTNEHPGQGLVLPIDSAPGPDQPSRRPDLARRGSPGTTRRSVWRRRTRSPCTSTGRRATSAARTLSPPSTTASSTGTRSSRRTASRCRTTASTSRSSRATARP